MGAELSSETDRIALPTEDGTDLSIGFPRQVEPCIDPWEIGKMPADFQKSNINPKKVESDDSSSGELDSKLFNAKSKNIKPANPVTLDDYLHIEDFIGPSVTLPKKNEQLMGPWPCDWKSFEFPGNINSMKLEPQRDLYDFGKKSSDSQSKSNNPVHTLDSLLQVDDFKRPLVTLPNEVEQLEGSWPCDWKSSDFQSGNINSMKLEPPDDLGEFDKKSSDSESKIIKPINPEHTLDSLLQVDDFKGPLVSLPNEVEQLKGSWPCDWKSSDFLSGNINSVKLEPPKDLCEFDKEASDSESKIIQPINPEHTLDSLLQVDDFKGSSVNLPNEVEQLNGSWPFDFIKLEPPDDLWEFDKNASDSQSKIIKPIYPEHTLDSLLQIDDFNRPLVTLPKKIEQLNSPWSYDWKPSALKSEDINLMKTEPQNKPWEFGKKSSDDVESKNIKSSYPVTKYNARIAVDLTEPSVTLPRKPKKLKSPWPRDLKSSKFQSGGNNPKKIKPQNNPWKFGKKSSDNAESKKVNPAYPVTTHDAVSAIVDLTAPSVTLPKKVKQLNGPRPCKAKSSRKIKPQNNPYEFGKKSSNDAKSKKPNSALPVTTHDAVLAIVDLTEPSVTLPKEVDLNDLWECDKSSEFQSGNINPKKIEPKNKPWEFSKKSSDNAESKNSYPGCPMITYDAPLPIKDLTRPSVTIPTEVKQLNASWPCDGKSSEFQSGDINPKKVEPENNPWEFDKKSFDNAKSKIANTAYSANTYNELMPIKDHTEPSFTLQDKVDSLKGLLELAKMSSDDAESKNVNSVVTYDSNLPIEYFKRRNSPWEFNKTSSDIKQINNNLRYSQQENVNEEKSLRFVDKSTNTKKRKIGGNKNNLNVKRQKRLTFKNKNKENKPPGGASWTKHYENEFLIDLYEPSDPAKTPTKILCSVPIPRKQLRKLKSFKNYFTKIKSSKSSRT